MKHRRRIIGYFFCIFVSFVSFIGKCLIFCVLQRHKYRYKIFKIGHKKSSVEFATFFNACTYYNYLIFALYGLPLDKSPMSHHLQLNNTVFFHLLVLS